MFNKLAQSGGSWLLLGTKNNDKDKICLTLQTLKIRIWVVTETVMMSHLGSDPELKVLPEAPEELIKCPGFTLDLRLTTGRNRAQACALKNNSSGGSDVYPG